jgi:hypothetical protein
MYISTEFLVALSFLPFQIMGFILFLNRRNTFPIQQRSNILAFLFSFLSFILSWIIGLQNYISQNSFWYVITQIIYLEEVEQKN